MTPTRVVIYARCSDAKQVEKDLSIPAQIDACRAEAARQGWVVVQDYVDEGISGRTDDRPAFQEMIAKAKENPKPFDVILLWKLSRFARNREHATFYKNLLRKRGVAVTSLHERVDDSAQGRLIEGIFEAMDQFYSENLAQDTKRGMIRKVMRGDWVGGAVPLGYRVERVGSAAKDAKLVVNEAEAPLVQRIFADALRGMGGASVARTLNREGSLTRSGRKWTNDVVLYLLRNRMYLGELRWGRNADGSPLALLKNAHAPLVDEESFNRIAELIVGRINRNVSPRRLGGNYLLSGLLRCGHCGTAFIGAGAKSGKFHYYGCPTKVKSGSDQCPSVLLNQEVLEAAIVDHLSQHVLQVAPLRTMLADVNQGLTETTRALVAEADAKRGQLSAQRQQLTRLVDALALGTIDPGAIAGRLNELKRSTDLLAAEVANLDARRAEAAPVHLSDEELYGYCENLRTILTTRPIDEQRAFLGAWIQKMEATGRTITVTYTVPGADAVTARQDVTNTPTAFRRAKPGEPLPPHARVNQIRRVLSTAASGTPSKNRTCV